MSNVCNNAVDSYGSWSWRCPAVWGRLCCTVLIEPSWPWLSSTHTTQWWSYSRPSLLYFSRALKESWLAWQMSLVSSESTISAGLSWQWGVSETIWDHHYCGYQGTWKCNTPAALPSYLRLQSSPYLYRGIDCCCDTTPPDGPPSCFKKNVFSCLIDQIYCWDIS